jgi:cobalt-precorrin-5B (C1)-methyltransferase
MEQYIEKDGKRLRLGYTTGSCAAAAAKAAAWMLLTGRRKETITLDTPKGIRLELAVREITMRADSVSCAIEKDSGDDPDVTKGTLIFASVRRTDEPGGETAPRLHALAEELRALAARVENAH